MVQVFNYKFPVLAFDIPIGYFRLQENQGNYPPEEVKKTKTNLIKYTHNL